MENKTSVKNISIFGAFALSIGTAIGWGSFVVTGSNFVSKAGPLGSVIGLIIGMILMIVIAHNYHYMMTKYPDNNGGIYSFAKHTIGGDHAFLIGWFLLITYSAILWANVSAISLFADWLLPGVFKFGFSYKIGTDEIWLGQILLSAFFLCLFGGICLLNKKITTRIQFGLALIFIAIIIAGFIIAAIMHEGGLESYKPDFAPTGENEFAQVIRIIGMVPWAFIGFESISHSSKHFKFAQKKTFKVFLASILVAGLLYILMCELCISTFPKDQNYKDWSDYLANVGDFEGVYRVPAIFVMHEYIGVFGAVMFCIALFAVIMTSIIGNTYALMGLSTSMAEDGVLPKFFAKVDKNDNPRNVIFGVIILTIVMLFLGRALILWIVDVNNICGVIVYTYISAITFYQARKDKNKIGKIVGIAGLVIGIGYALALMILSVVSIDWIAKESVAIFLIWAVIGFAYYAFLLKRDKKKMFGHSLAASFGLYALIIFCIGSWLAMMVKTYNDNSVTVAGIIVCVFIAILTQIVFFAVFSTIRKREVDMQDKLVLGMATMVEGRDNSTGGHIKRTSKVVELIVDEMIKDGDTSLHHRFCTNVIKAAPMHDLGKVAIDDAILRKPGKFTPEEYAEMKKHPVEGARIVGEILEGTSDHYFREIAINVAHYHHERWDGSGYPEGLKGEEIPLEARIMAIADVYDALVSKRVYKEEFSFEKANQIILEGMGTQFDKGLEKYYRQAREKIEKFYQENK